MNKITHSGIKFRTVLLFILFVTFAPVVITLCFDGCSNQGVGAFIVGPLSLFGILTLFRLEPWIAAILFSSVMIIGIALIKKLKAKHFSKITLIALQVTLFILAWIAFAHLQKYL